MSDYIPEEIQFQILKLLPVKTLLRFQCVSKRWKQFIDSPSFLQQHLALQNPQSIIECNHSFFVLDPDTLPLFNNLTGPIDDPTRFSLLGTLHGVVCLYDHKMELFSLWNPSLRKFSSLPRPVIDPSYSTYGFYSSFWIDPSTKHFKFLSFKLAEAEAYDYDGDDDDGGVVLANLYSSIVQDWEVLSVGGLRFLEPIEQHSSVVIGGVAYCETYFGIEDDWQMEILSFDFDRPRFDVIQKPQTESRDWCQYPVLCNWKGALSLVYLYEDKRCDIYLRQQGLWVNKYRFNLPSSVTRVFWALVERDAFQVEELQENSRILAKVGDADELVLCEARVDSVPLGTGLDAHEPLIAYDFVESLLFPYIR